ncbi:MAG: PilZ domain-containing protein [Thiotrichales bacterium]|nr:MAG: PilZ domain-containing protein [Thiotrichales bacterium]
MISIKSAPYERRSAHRYKVKLPVELILEDGTVLPVEATDISSKGLQFSCDSWVADEIEPRGIQNHPLDQIRLKAVTDFPGMDKYNSRLYARCRIIVARRLSQDEYVLGIEFIDFENGSDRLLEKFIRECEQKYRHKATPSG